MSERKELPVQEVLGFALQGRPGPNRAEAGWVYWAGERSEVRRGPLESGWKNWADSVSAIVRESGWLISPRSG